MQLHGKIASSLLVTIALLTSGCGADSGRWESTPATTPTIHNDWAWESRIIVPVQLAQSTMQCGIVPIKPIPPVQCADLTPVCNTSTNKWEWSCVPRTRPMQCGLTPLKPLIPVGCSDLIPECNTETGKWHWLCETRN